MKTYQPMHSKPFDGSPAQLNLAHREKRVEVAVYYFPNYHADDRNAQHHGQGWTEWELVRRAMPRWSGHDQPRTPAWGYTDEADPREMERKISVAAGHAIDTFIFDWYWYEDGPFLQRALDEGFLHAKNRNSLKFALMWANHDWTDIHPARLNVKPAVLYPGTISRKGFDSAVEHVVTRYFSQPNYWLIDDRPYFSFYDLPALISGLGGIDRAAEALREFRKRTQRAGHPDLHLNLVWWQHTLLLGERYVELTPEMLQELGFDSITSYVWVHHVPMQPFPVTDYAKAMLMMRDYSAFVRARFPSVPYYPNVTVGWDATPRTSASEPFVERGYPYMSSFDGNTPAAFRVALEQAKKDALQLPPNQRIVTINAWNEWTEGSYLEPDTKRGLAYLEAIQATFCCAPSSEKEDPRG